MWLTSPKGTTPVNQTSAKTTNSEIQINDINSEVQIIKERTFLDSDGSYHLEKSPLAKLKIR